MKTFNLILSACAGCLTMMLALPAIANDAPRPQLPTSTCRQAILNGMRSKSTLRTTRSRNIRTRQAYLGEGLREGLLYPSL
jgi:hypothetical protein